MSNNKQSSIDWLEEEFVKLESTIGVQGVFYELLEQAKAMHKQELLNIFNCGRNFQATGEGTFNEIYNEIYGS